MAFKDFSFAQYDAAAALSLGVTSEMIEGNSKVYSYCGDITNSACSTHSGPSTPHCQSIQSSACTAYRR